MGSTIPGEDAAQDSRVGGVLCVAWQILWSDGDRPSDFNGDGLLDLDRNRFLNFSHRSLLTWR